MKLTKAKIIIKDKKKIKNDLADALAGKKRVIQKDNEIVFNSVESFVKIMTRSRLEVLIFLIKNKPKSIYELAKDLGRDFSNVHADVTKLANLQFIVLEKSNNSRNGLIPKAKYSGLEINLVA